MNLTQVPQEAGIEIHDVSRHSTVISNSLSTSLQLILQPALEAQRQMFCKGISLSARTETNMDTKPMNFAIFLSQLRHCRIIEPGTYNLSLEGRCSHMTAAAFLHEHGAIFLAPLPGMV